MTKATSRPSCCHCVSSCDNCMVVTSLPCSSSATMRAPFGNAASILLHSCNITVSAVLLPERSIGLISFNRMRHSAGILLVYSLKPDSIQFGILWPTAVMMSCMAHTTAVYALARGARLAGALRGAVALFGAATLMVLPTAFLAGAFLFAVPVVAVLPAVVEARGARVVRGAGAAALVVVTRGLRAALFGASSSMAWLASTASAWALVRRILVGAASSPSRLAAAVEATRLAAPILTSFSPQISSRRL